MNKELVLWLKREIKGYKKVLKDMKKQNNIGWEYFHFLGQLQAYEEILRMLEEI